MKSSDQILATAHLLNLKVIFPHGPVAVCSVCAFQTKVFVHRPGSRTKQYTIPTDYQCFFMSPERRGLLYDWQFKYQQSFSRIMDFTFNLIVVYVEFLLHDVY